MKTSKEQKEAIDRLREILRPGDTVKTVLLHVSRSGMMRVIMPVFKDEDISYLVAQATGLRLNRKHGGVTLTGFGMDMGFSLVYDLSQVLFRDGFICIGEGCPSNDHSNGDRDYTPHSHNCGGYALKQRWL